MELYTRKYYWGSYQYVWFYVAFENKHTYELIKNIHMITKSFSNLKNKQKELITIKIFLKKIQKEIIYNKNSMIPLNQISIFSEKIIIL